MRIAPVEIFSDTTNPVVLRHPDRRFPGILVQGDSLYAMCALADSACSAARGSLTTKAYKEINELRNQLWGYLTHYKVVLGEHQLPLPFSEQPDA